MAAILEDGKLRLSGYVGDYYFEDGFTSSDVVVALAGIDDEADLDVHLNSPGGIATEGAAIHALLSARSGTTNIVVEGIAASAASLIAMAGDTVTMSLGAVMMIHDPSGFTFGTAADHEKTVEGLEALATAYARVYAAKSGKSAEDCRAIMREERWFTPEQAVEEGFADEVAGTKAEAVAAFDYRVFEHAPKRLTALAAKKNWRLPDADQRAAMSAAKRPNKETTMTDKERADQLAAELAELKAKPDAATAAADAVKADRIRRAEVMALEEAKGREKLAERLATTSMSVDDIKATLADAPKAEANNDAEMHEQRRLNGEGLNGGRKPAASVRTGNQAEATAAAVAKMKAMLNLKEGA